MTIVSLAFGTFTQQLLAFRPFPTSDDTLKPGNIQRSEDWGATGTALNHNPVVAYELSTPMTLKAAVNTAAFIKNTQAITAFCPTGNCTWPLTPSLAICGACTEYSYYQTQCFQNKCNNTQGFCPTFCKYTMPSGSVATLGDYTQSPSIANNFGIGRIGFQVMQGNGFVYKPNDTRLYVSNFDVFGAPCGYKQINIWPNQSTVASECALWFCVQSFNTTISKSHQTQTVVQSFPTVVNSSMWIGDGANINNNITFMDLPSTMMPRPHANFAVNWQAQDLVESYLLTTMNGTVVIDSINREPSNDVVDALWAASGDLDGWIKNLAAGMTNFVRTVRPQSDSMYDGTGYELGVEVRWGWIVLPVALVLASLLMLVAGIIRTRHNRISAWKGSPLAFLFMDVDPAIREQAAGQFDVYDGLRDAVGGNKVVMEKGGVAGRMLKLA